MCGFLNKWQSIHWEVTVYYEYSSLKLMAYCESSKLFFVCLFVVVFLNKIQVTQGCKFRTEYTWDSYYMCLIVKVCSGILIHCSSLLCSTSGTKQIKHSVKVKNIGVQWPLSIYSRMFSSWKWIISNNHSFILHLFNGHLNKLNCKVLSAKFSDMLKRSSRHCCCATCIMLSVVNTE